MESLKVPSIEESIGSNMEALRKNLGISQAELGRRLASYLGNPWSRQAVSAAVRGGRAFTAVELIAIAAELNTTIPQLLQSSESIELPGARIMKPEHLAAVLVYDNDSLEARLRLLQALTILERSYKDISNRAAAQSLVIASAKAAVGSQEDAQLLSPDEDSVYMSAYMGGLRHIVDEWSQAAATQPKRKLRNLRQKEDQDNG